MSFFYPITKRISRVKTLQFNTFSNLIISRSEIATQNIKDNSETSSILRGSKMLPTPRLENELTSHSN